MKKKCCPPPSWLCISLISPPQLLHRKKNLNILNFTHPNVHSQTLKHKTKNLVVGMQKLCNNTFVCFLFLKITQENQSVL